MQLAWIGGGLVMSDKKIIGVLFTYDGDSEAEFSFSNEVNVNGVNIKPGDTFKLKRGDVVKDGKASPKPSINMLQ